MLLLPNKKVKLILFHLPPLTEEFFLMLLPSELLDRVLLARLFR